MKVKSQSLLGDSIWVAATQFISALGTLAGVRILTEFMTPVDFGEMSLWLGVVSLFTSTLANPTMQALLRFYPEYTAVGQGGLIRKVTRIQVEKLLLWSFPVILVLAWVAFDYGWASPTLLLLLALVLCIDIVRMQYLALLSASRNQKIYGAWMALEAWFRPVFAVLGMLLWGINIESIFAGYLCASVIIWFFLRPMAPVDLSANDVTHHESIDQRIWKYSFPLLPLGLIGWLSGVGDRYIIGGVLGIADVGLYAAVYGLASRPVLMLGTIVETTIRPVYQHTVITGDKVLQRNYLMKWLLTLFVCSGFGLTLAFFFHDWLAKVFLGPAFRSGSYLIPWLVFAHILLIFAQRHARILLAHSKTSVVAKIETIPVLFALLFSWVLSNRFGLQGAVLAVIIGFGLQWLMYFVYTQFIHRHSVPVVETT